MAMSSKIVALVTGGKKGIGYEVAKKLATDPKYQVIITSREKPDGIKCFSRCICCDETCS